MYIHTYTCVYSMCTYMTCMYHLQFVKILASNTKIFLQRQWIIFFIFFRYVSVILYIFWLHCSTMEYAEQFWSASGVVGLGAKCFMRGTKFLESTWVGDNDALEQQLESFFNEQEAKGLAPNATPMNDTDNFGHTALSQLYIVVTCILSDSCAKNT